MAIRYKWLLSPALIGGLLPIAQIAYCAQYLSAETARAQAFPGATDFQRLVLTPEIKTLVERRTSRFMTEPQLWQARAGERLLGWFFVDDVIGKQELITYALALDVDGAVKALDVLTYRESHGDGVRLPNWGRQFVGKRLNDPIRLDADIRNISGATLSCRHVTEGVRRLLLLREQLASHDGA